MFGYSLQVVFPLMHFFCPACDLEEVEFEREQEEDEQKEPGEEGLHSVPV